MVASLVTLFKKLKFVTDENVGWGPIDLPELELQTTAYWLTADRARQHWRRDDLDVALLGARSRRSRRSCSWSTRAIWAW
jgi:DEAD/DEAH box helicase domain-containing protein